MLWVAFNLNYLLVVQRQIFEDERWLFHSHSPPPPPSFYPNNYTCSLACFRFIHYWIYVLLFLLENCLSPLCVFPSYPLPLLSRPLQDGDIINIDVTVSNFCFKQPLINFRMASSNRKNSRLQMQRAQIDECAIFTSKPRHQQLVSSFVFVCLFQLDSGLT